MPDCESSADFGRLMDTNFIYKSRSFVNSPELACMVHAAKYTNHEKIILDPSRYRTIRNHRMQ